MIIVAEWMPWSKWKQGRQARLRTKRLVAGRHELMRIVEFDTTKPHKHFVGSDDSFSEFYRRSGRILTQQPFALMAGNFPLKRSISEDELREWAQQLLTTEQKQ